MEADDQKLILETENIKVKVTSWIDEDGNIVNGVVLDDDDDDNKNKNKDGDIGAICSICFQQLTIHGNHRICCLPCGHMYGLSCLNNWLQPCKSSRNCPQCNTLCTLEDVRLLYPGRLDPTLEKASTTHFPFNKQGFNAFNGYLKHRWLDTIKLRRDTLERQDNALKRWCDTSKRHAYALGRHAEAHKRHADALGRRGVHSLEQLVVDLARRADALGLRAVVLERRVRVLGERVNTLQRQAHACKESMKFFKQRYKEHRSARQNTEH